MADQYAIQDQNQFAGMLGHSNTTDAAETRRWVVGNNGAGLMQMGDSPSIDAFARQRVSDPTTLFDSQLQYNDQPLLWESVYSGGGTSTHKSDESAVELSVGTSSGDSVIRQTYQYFRYQPGKSQLVLETGVMGAAVAGVTRRVGYYDNNDGIFFEQKGTSGVGLVLRSSTSGSAVDTRYEQADWNLDTMDGNGESGYNLDFSKAQIFLVDFEWLGVGRVRSGFVMDGIPIYSHEINNANNVTGVYMKTPNLPLRYELVNTTNTAGTTTLKQICASVISEGGFQDDRGIIHSVDNDITGVALGTAPINVLSIRPKSTFNSIENRGNIAPLSVDVLSTGQPMHYELVYGGTLAGGTANTWTSVGANSIAEYCVAGSAVSGGEVISSGYLPTSTTSGKVSLSSDSVKSRLYLGLDYAGTRQHELSLVVRTLSGSGTAFGAIAIKEFY